MAVPPFRQVMAPIRGEATYAPTTCAVDATPAFQRRDALPVSPALVTLTEGKMMLQITNSHNHTFTFNSCTAVATFKVITPQQAANTKPAPHALVLLMSNHSEDSSSRRVSSSSGDPYALR